MRYPAVIPARFDSTRFPGKPLAEILEKPLIEWVYNGVKDASRISKVVVATDDQRIAEAVQRFGAEFVMTGKAARNGTERVAEALQKIQEAGQALPEVVVNIQGDEPLITGDVVDLAVQALEDDPDASVGTVAFQAPDEETYLDENCVKVVLDHKSRALYFSRAPIPFNRNPGAAPLVHVGIYAYRLSELLKYISWSPGNLESSESLEQLRFLEHGRKIAVAMTGRPVPGVDTPESLHRAEIALRARLQGDG